MPATPVCSPFNGHPGGVEGVSCWQATTDAWEPGTGSNRVYTRAITSMKVVIAVDNGNVPESAGSSV
jgi:hypothetical protein